MKANKAINFLFPILLVIFLFFVLSIMVTVASAIITVSPNVHFGFCNNNYINFNTQQTFYNINRTNNIWYFDNIGVQVENANITFETLTNNEIEFTVYPSDEATTEIKSATKPSAVIIDGVQKQEGDQWQWINNAVTSTTNTTANIQLIWTEANMSLGQEFWHELFYGEGKWFGIIVMLAIIIVVCKKAPYAAILFMPITIFLALDYFNKIPSDNNFIWAALVMLFASVFILLSIIQKAK